MSQPDNVVDWNKVRSRTTDLFERDISAYPAEYNFKSADLIKIGSRNEDLPILGQIIDVLLLIQLSREHAQTMAVSDSIGMTCNAIIALMLDLVRDSHQFKIMQRKENSK